MTRTIDAPVEAPTPAEEKPSPMKLSEALRIGSMDTVQAHGSWSKASPDGGVATMCAIQTAWYALTGSDRGGASSPLADMLGNVSVAHPVSGDAQPIGGVIINLNDTHKWSRAKIAGWLEELGL
jgi:hypothetical protein